MHPQKLQVKIARRYIVIMVWGAIMKGHFFFPVAIVEGTFQYFEVNPDHPFHVVEYFPLTDMTKWS